MKTLQECLADYDTVLLRAIAERRGVELGSSHQPEMAQQMAGALLQPASIAEALDWLTVDERRVLDTLLANGGRGAGSEGINYYGFNGAESLATWGCTSPRTSSRSPSSRAAGLAAAARAPSSVTSVTRPAPRELTGGSRRVEGTCILSM